MPVINPLPEKYTIPVNEKTKPFYFLIANLLTKYYKIIINDMEKI